MVNRMSSSHLPKSKKYAKTWNLGNQIIMKSLDPLRSKKKFIRKKLGHTAVSAIKASSVTLQTWQKEPMEITVNLQFLTWQSF